MDALHVNTATTPRTDPVICSAIAAEIGQLRKIATSPEHLAAMLDDLDAADPRTLDARNVISSSKHRMCTRIREAIMIDPRTGVPYVHGARRRYAAAQFV